MSCKPSSFLLKRAGLSPIFQLVNAATRKLAPLFHTAGRCRHICIDAVEPAKLPALRLYSAYISRDITGFQRRYLISFRLLCRIDDDATGRLRTSRARPRRRSLLPRAQRWAAGGRFVTPRKKPLD